MGASNTSIDISNFPYKCMKILPMVYDDSLSYYEVICKLNSFVVDLVDDFNTVFSSIDATIASKVAEQVNVFMGEVTAELSNMRDEIQTKDDAVYFYLGQQIGILLDNINSFKGTVNASLSNFGLEITKFKAFVRTQLDSYIAYVDAQNTLQNNDVNAKFDDVYEIIDNLEIEYPLILNPATGVMSTIQQVLSSMYSILSLNAMNCTEFDANLKTVTQLEAYNLTTTQFDTQSKLLLV